MRNQSDDILIKALQANDASELAQLLDAGRNAAERFNLERTPLHIAAEAGSVECTRVLLKHGAVLEAQDEIGFTALICALDAGHAKVAEDLISAGALLHYRYSPEDTLEIREQFRRDWEKYAALSEQAYPEVYRALDAVSFIIPK